MWIEDIIKEKFGSVYCDTCESNKLDFDDENCYCEDCCRKQMNWGVSESCAKGVANSIKQELLKKLGEKITTNGSSDYNKGFVDGYNFCRDVITKTLKEGGDEEN